MEIGKSRSARDLPDPCGDLRLLFAARMKTNTPSRAHDREREHRAARHGHESNLVFRRDNC